MQTERNRLEGRDIYVVTGPLSQTVNVCDAANQRGKYEWIVRLFQPRFITGTDVDKWETIHDLMNWLTRERGGKLEQHPVGEEDIVATTIVEETVSPEDALWIQRAMRITEVCIDELVREFLELPYLHRVEHSIHTRLYSILRNQPHFDRYFSLAEPEMLTQPIHKEWPEVIPRPDKGRRGNFDLAILSPGRLMRSTPSEFSEGRVAPLIAIEMGLNYGEGHLAGDAEKLLITPNPIE